MNVYARNLILALAMVFLWSSTLTNGVYADSSSQLGTRYDVPPAEIQAAEAITNLIEAYSRIADYSPYNWYGSQTTRSNIYSAATGVGHDFSISFYIGHGKFYNFFRLPFGFEKQWYISDYLGNEVYDMEIYSQPEITRPEFVFLWACFQGDTKGGFHWSGTPYGMALGWLWCQVLSDDGYYDPDGLGQVFLGFGGVAPYITHDFWTEDETFLQDAGYWFLTHFYYAALRSSAFYTINQALDYAVLHVWGDPSYGDSILYNGYTITDHGPGGPEVFPGQMKVFGDGNLYICGIGGCPFVFTWNGKNFVKDNNILPTSLRNSGIDVEDFYRLEQPLVPRYGGAFFSFYTIKIAEFESEHSYIDQVRVFAVDHKADFEIAVTPEGRIVTYQKPLQPESCFDGNGIDRLNEIISENGDLLDSSTFFDGQKGDYLTIDFGKVNTTDAKLILRDDKKCFEIPYCCIEVQIQNNSQWQTVSVVAPREYWATEAVDLSAYVTPGSNFFVRLYWTLPHRLDYVGLDTSSDQVFELRNATIISAVHSVAGNVRSRILNNDQSYAELMPGQELRIAFLLPSNQCNIREFVLYTEGHYYRIEN